MFMYMLAMCVIYVALDVNGFIMKNFLNGNKVI